MQRKEIERNRMERVHRYIITVKTPIMGETYKQREVEVRNAIQTVLDIANKYQVNDTWIAPLLVGENDNNRIKNFIGKRVAFQEKKHEAPVLNTYTNAWVIKETSSYPTQTFKIKVVTVNPLATFFTTTYHKAM